MDKTEALNLVRCARGGYRNQRSPYHAPNVVPALCDAIVELVKALEEAEAPAPPPAPAPAPAKPPPPAKKAPARKRASAKKKA